MDRVKNCETKFFELFGTAPVQNEGDDAEFMRILQRFIFGEVFFTGSLSDCMRELVTITVLAAEQALPQLKAHTAASLRIGVSPLQVREAVYRCAPYIGFPKTLNAIAAVNEAFAACGAALPRESAEQVNEQTRYAAGLALQTPLYGDEIAERYAWLPAPFNEAVPRFLTELCFGDFSTRKGIGGKEGELLTVVLLAALGGAEAQVRAHVAGALKAGNTREEIVCALVHAMCYMGFPRLFNALNCCKDLLSQETPSACGGQGKPEAGARR